MNTDAPAPQTTRPCAACGDPFELGRIDFFRVEFTDHGIWTTVYLCGVKCLRRWASGPVPWSPERTNAQPNRERK